MKEKNQFWSFVFRDLTKTFLERAFMMSREYLLLMTGNENNDNFFENSEEGMGA